MKIVNPEYTETIIEYDGYKYLRRVYKKEQEVCWLYETIGPITDIELSSILENEYQKLIENDKENE